MIDPNIVLYFVQMMANKTAAASSEKGKTIIIATYLFTKLHKDKLN